MNLCSRSTQQLHPPTNEVIPARRWLVIEITPNSEAEQVFELWLKRAAITPGWQSCHSTIASNFGEAIITLAPRLNYCHILNWMEVAAYLCQLR